jgi:IS30 family transposase
MKYEKLGYGDIVRIEFLLKEKMKQTEIAIQLSRNKSTISRCIRTYRDELGEFEAEVVWEKIKENRRNRKGHRKILEDELLKKYILEKIEINWTPEQVSGRWRAETGKVICHETIYKFVYDYHPHLVKLYFRRKGKKYQHDRKAKYQIKERRMIDERPTSVETREIMGHWEGDTIVGKNHKQGIITNVERKSGLLLAQKIPRRTAENVADVTKEMFDTIPDELKISMTYDNGREFAWHKVIETQNNMTVYFAHPYSSWERGSNENTNGLLRQFIPKKTDFNTVSVDDLDKYVDLINNRPRKRLGWKTPFEVFYNIPVAFHSRI